MCTFSSTPSTYQLLMPNSNTYLTGLGATIFALIKQRQGSLLSSERARDEITPLADNSWGHSCRHHPSLGVTLSSNLQMDIHVDTALATCASSMYALRVLRSHGLPQQSLHEVAKMTTVSALMYASPPGGASPVQETGRGSGSFWPG